VILQFRDDSAKLLILGAGAVLGQQIIEIDGRMAVEQSQNCPFPSVTGSRQLPRWLMFMRDWCLSVRLLTAAIRTKSGVAASAREFLSAD
jgi:hypothetical protein